jgi:hypothetical protein
MWGLFEWDAASSQMFASQKKQILNFVSISVCEFYDVKFITEVGHILT